jgi:hypothetical protein
VAKSTAENKGRNIILKELLKAVNGGVIVFGITDRLLGTFRK